MYSITSKPCAIASLITGAPARSPITKSPATLLSLWPLSAGRPSTISPLARMASIRCLTLLSTEVLQGSDQVRHCPQRELVTHPVADAEIAAIPGRAPSCQLDVILSSLPRKRPEVPASGHNLRRNRQQGDSVFRSHGRAAARKWREPLPSRAALRCALKLPFPHAA